MSSNAYFPANTTDLSPPSNSNLTRAATTVPSLSSTHSPLPRSLTTPVPSHPPSSLPPLLSTSARRSLPPKRNFAAATAAALAFPTNTGGPRRRRTFADLVNYELGGGDESGSEDAGSNVDELDRVQLEWASSPTGEEGEKGKEHGKRRSSEDKGGRRVEHVPSFGVPGLDIFDREIGNELEAGKLTEPPPFVLGRAIFDFEPRDALEHGYLTFKKGDLIVVTGMFSGRSSWWYGKAENGRAGLFLAYHVEKVELGGPVSPASLPQKEFQLNQRLLSAADVSSLETSRRIVNSSGPAVFRRYDFLSLHILLDYQRRLRAYELPLEGLFTNPEKVTNEEYRDLMASLDDTLTHYHDALIRYRDIQSLELSSWTEANEFAHVVLPFVPKSQKTTVDAGVFCNFWERRCVFSDGENFET